MKPSALGSYRCRLQFADPHIRPLLLQVPDPELTNSSEGVRNTNSEPGVSSAEAESAF